MTKREFYGLMLGLTAALTVIAIWPDWRLTPLLSMLAMMAPIALAVSWR